MNQRLLLIILAAIIVVLAFAVVKLWQAKQTQEKNYTSIIAEKNDSIHYFKNDRGKIIAEKVAAQASVKELTESYPEVVKQLKDEFDIKMKDMKAFVENKFLAQGSGIAEIHNHYTAPDSAGRRYPYWELKASDGYLSFKADVIDSLHAPYTYSYNDTITTVIAVRKRNWFAKEKLYASTKLQNPNARATATTNLLVDSYKDKRWVIWVGTGYDVINNSVMLGAGVGYSLLKF